MREIDYDQLRKHVDDMINTAEYDAMRSAGKCKMNADVLVNLYKLKEIYALPKVTPKAAVRKEGK